MGLATQYQFFNVLQALTREGILSANVIDTVFRDAKIFAWLRQKDQVVMMNGGAAIIWNINVGRSPNTKAFWGVQPLPINAMNTNIIRAALNWHAYADALVVALTDVAMNNGSPEAIANIVDVQMGVVKNSLVEKLSIDAIANTQAINPLQFDGLAAAIDNGTVASSYAGISRSGLYAPNWNSVTNYDVNATANFLNTVHATDVQASVAGERPDTYFCTPNCFASSVESLTNNDRYWQPDMARAAGGYDLIFNGKPLYIDQYLPTGVASPDPNYTPPVGTSNSGGLFYGLNSSYMKLVVHPNFNFAAQEWESAQSNAAFFSRMFFFGNLVCEKPTSCFVLWQQGS
jgi:hypothetical protein